MEVRCDSDEQIVRYLWCCVFVLCGVCCDVFDVCVIQINGLKEHKMQEKKQKLNTQTKNNTYYSRKYFIS